MDLMRSNVILCGGVYLYFKSELIIILHEVFVNPSEGIGLATTQSRTVFYNVGSTGPFESKL